MEETSSMNDHDLLVTLHEQIKNVRDDIRDLKDDTKAKVTDHEMRIRRLELWGAIAVGISYAMQFYFNYLR